jgi:hypothetical protein
MNKIIIIIHGFPQANDPSTVVGGCLEIRTAGCNRWMQPQDLDTRIRGNSMPSKSSEINVARFPMKIKELRKAINRQCIIDNASIT